MKDDTQDQTQIFPPYERHEVAVHGYLVPRLEIKPLEGANDGVVNTILDRRFAVCTNAEEAKKWVPLIAHALAIGAGFCCHGENSAPTNEYKTKVMHIGPADTE